MNDDRRTEKDGDRRFSEAAQQLCLEKAATQREKLLVQCESEIADLEDEIARLKEWRPIETAPKDKPYLQIFAFADYTDEPKGVDVITVAELEIFKQYTWWMPFSLPLPPHTAEWCDCVGCQMIKLNWTTEPPHAK